jgi:hypothetical protein
MLGTQAHHEHDECWCGAKDFLVVNREFKFHPYQETNKISSFFALVVE